MKIYVVTIFRNYSKRNIAKVLFLSEAVVTSSHEKTARDVLQLLFHLALMKMSFTRVHSNRGSFYKCVFTCFFDHVVFKCLETVLIIQQNLCLD